MSYQAQTFRFASLLSTMNVSVVTAAKGLHFCVILLYGRFFVGEMAVRASLSQTLQSNDHLSPQCRPSSLFLSHLLLLLEMEKHACQHQIVTDRPHHSRSPDIRGHVMLSMWRLESFSVRDSCTTAERLNCH